MTQQTIGVGTLPNDGTGDPLRTAMIKSNANFTELYYRMVASTSDPTVANDNTQGFTLGSFWFNSNSGRVFVARGVATGAAVWNLVGAGDHPGYIPGNWYNTSDGVMSTFNAGSALTAGQIRAYPFIIRERLTINALGAKISVSGAGGNCQFAIHAHNPATGRPTGLPLASTASISTTTATNVSAAAAAQFEPAVYWAAANVDNTSVNFISFNSVCGAGALIGSATQSTALGTQVSINGVSVTQTFGTWPDLTSASFSELQSNANPVIQFKVASVP